MHIAIDNLNPIPFKTTNKSNDLTTITKIPWNTTTTLTNNVASKVSVVTSANNNDNNNNNAFDVHMVAGSFQSIWTKLSAQDLIQSKKEAYEIIDKTTKLASESGYSLVKIPRAVCGFIGRRTSSCPIRRCPLLNEEQLLIVAMSKVPYSDKNPLHWELLNSIYRHIIVDAQSGVPRYGTHWEKIGFQGTDPATDLRGVGLLGLCQLLFLVSNGLTHQMIIQLLDLSNDDIQNFPLAIVGLNFTQMILERVEQGKLNYLAAKENSYISCVNGIYRGCFIVFQRIWKSRLYTIVNFLKVKEEIKEIIKRRPKSLLNMAMLD